MFVVIERRTTSAVDPVLGSLVVRGDSGKREFWCDTIENPERLIAANEYVLRWSKSPRFSKAAGKDVWTPEIIMVEGRAGLRIHTVNHAFDLEGCIGVGRGYKDLNKDSMLDITRSKQAYAELVDCLLTGGIRESDFKITIRDAYRLRVGNIS